MTTDNTEITAITKEGDNQEINFDEIDDFVPQLLGKKQSGISEEKYNRMTIREEK